MLLLLDNFVYYISRDMMFVQLVSSGGEDDAHLKKFTRITFKQTAYDQTHFQKLSNYSLCLHLSRIWWYTQKPRNMLRNSPCLVRI